MDTTKELKESGQAFLDVGLSASEVAEEIAFIETHFAAESFPGEGLDKYRAALMERQAEKAMCQEGLLPLTMPLFRTKDNLADGKGFAFQVVFFPKPELGLNLDTPISVKAASAAVSQDLIEARIDEIRENYRVLCTKEEGSVVEAEDSVEFAIETTMDGEPYSPLSASKRLYKLGEGFLSEEFDQALMGMAQGETKNIEFIMDVAPPEGDEEPEKKTFRSTVTIQALLHDEVPAVDDEWVAQAFPEVGTAEALCQLVEQEIGDEQKAIIEEDRRYQAVSALAKRLEGPIPDFVFQAKINEFMQAFEAQAKDEGMTLPEYLKQQETDIGEFKMSIMLKVREQLKQAFALDAYARIHQIEAEQQDFDDFYQELNPSDPEQASREYKLNGRGYIAAEAALRIAATRHVLGHAIG